MAAAARPVAPAGRVPCPVCGALIHPVAGRCRHCKEDVRGFRVASAPAPVALPALAPAPVAPARPAAPPSPYAPPIAEAGSPAPPMAVVPPVAVAPASRDSAPILPPRTTARGEVIDARSAWRHWPIAVIVIAGIAIVGAVAVMLWPAHHPDAGSRVLEPPAPLDPMETHPEAPPTAPRAAPSAPPAAPPPAPSTSDPWDDPAPHARVAPIPAPADPFPLPNLGGDPQLALMTAAMQHYCRAQSACPDVEPVLEAACHVIDLQAVTPPSCPAATRCLARFDGTSCTTPMDVAGIEELFSTLEDCAQAARC